MSGDRVLRSSAQTSVSLAMAIVGVILAAITVRYAIAHHPGSSKTLGDQWLLTAFLLVGSMYLLLLSRTRVVVTDGSPTFVVKNVLRTHRIAWSDVDRFTERGVFIGGGPGGRSFVVKVRLRNGHSIRCTGISGIGFNCIEQQMELERLRIRIQGTGATTTARF
ncbi:MAG: hypothetical protein M3071_10580 [Actinomycetota bacterium]|nr:hypothetical protein [Actinomycetota bacterium]